MKCQAGFDMKIVEITKNGRPQLVWNCTHAACDACKRQRKSLRDGSFFSGIKIGMHQVLGIVWLYLYKVEMQGISDLTGASAPTVRSVIHLLYRLMNADIKDEDVTIGTFKYNKAAWFVNRGDFIQVERIAMGMRLSLKWMNPSLGNARAIEGIVSKVFGLLAV